MGSYSREGYLALVAEVTENTAVKPTVFVPLMSEDIVTEWGVVPATPVSAERTMNLRGVSKIIAGPNGTLNVLAEPKTMGYFLKGVFGAVSSGQLMKMTSASGDWAIADTVTGGSSAKTATVAYVSTELDYILVTSPSGEFTDGETITNAGTGTGTLTQHDATVFGHQFTAPQSSLPTYTVEIGLADKAYRYTGVRFKGLDSVAQSDNIITAGISMVARAQFIHGRVTAIVSGGAGTKTIPMDQTTGLVAADSIKVYRPGTGFLDFSAASTKTHTVASVASETSITVTNLETALAVGDLIMLAPQTPSYTIDSEFSWIGGSQVRIGDAITATVAASATCIEDFEIVLMNDTEDRYCANGVNVLNRFPAATYLKGLTGNGSITKTYTDDVYLNRLRKSTETAIQVVHTGSQIGTTGQYYQIDWRLPKVIFDPFNANISEDDLLNQEMPFNLYNSSDDGFTMKALLVTDVTSY